MSIPMTSFPAARCRVQNFHWGIIARFLIVVGFVFGEGLCVMAEPGKGTAADKKAAEGEVPAANDKLEEATFGSGCFWCTEAVFQELKGVKSIVSGYSGGRTKNPTYEDVSTGTTGHAEVIQVKFDPKVITYDELLEVFWKTHDPTTRDRQGQDQGTQYRSVIFYHNAKQKELAEGYKKKLDAAKAFRRPIVTQIVAFKEFYPGEAYHQNYFRTHPENPYCTMIQHKVEKFREVFRDKLKTDDSE
jgi:peptide-methionine (S)-S-oxide reductase